MCRLCASLTQHLGQQVSDTHHLSCSDGLRHDVAQIDADVKEAKGILAYMRRCCLCFLFSCCCDCDPSKKADETRQQRVEMYVRLSFVTGCTVYPEQC